MLPEEFDVLSEEMSTEEFDQAEALVQTLSSEDCSIFAHAEVSPEDLEAMLQTVTEVQDLLRVKSQNELCAKLEPVRNQLQDIHNAFFVDTIPKEA